ncbi:helix-turn-helix domain-containing protein [Sinorhizobium medicae]|nr:helix-turn-helix domain-containing protein [Sinorhizobium medicae]MDX1186328.1 helix-turn-helix domain-containing protein [Sinorhizobium medicae]MDX1222763.1 helix-turn-helix domain-containing protein [Sinorhizobium medicae]
MSHAHLDIESREFDTREWYAQRVYHFDIVSRACGRGTLARHAKVSRSVPLTLGNLGPTLGNPPCGAIIPPVRFFFPFSAHLLTRRTLPRLQRPAPISGLTMGNAFRHTLPPQPSATAEHLAGLIALGYARTEIARRAGVNRSALARIIDGREPTADEARRIERVWRGAMALGRVAL